MKKLKSFMVILITLIALIFATSYCTKEKPLCERNHFGHVIIHNHTSDYLWVDATSDGENFNDETRLAPNGSHKFTVDPGMVTVWAANDANKFIDNWNYDNITIYQCDEYSYTWTDKKGDVGNSYINSKDVGISKLKK
jgi:hypothetical protein